MTAEVEFQLELYRRMLRIRHFELAAMKLNTAGEIPGSLHTSIGQEATIVGACLAARIDDYMVGTHRSHGHPIGKGAAIGPLMAELMGKVTGVNRGKGGSMHLADFSVGSLGETSIVGSGLPVATGAALACTLQGNDKVTLCFFGDGASNEGTFHESLNLAAIWSLPVVFVCENNGYGQLTSARDVVAVERIASRAASYDMNSAVVDGQDVRAVYEAVSTAVARARTGEGPSLVEAVTYRYENHAFGLPIETYRTAEEIETWRQRDPIDLFRTELLATDQVTKRDVVAAEKGVNIEVEEAIGFARASDFPEPAEAFEHLYSNPFYTARDSLVHQWSVDAE